MSILESIYKLVPESNIFVKDKIIQAHIEKDQLETILIYTYEHLGFYWLRNICITDEQESFNVRYILKNPEESLVLIIKLNIARADNLKSIAPIWENAKSLESEAFEMYGINFDYIPERKYFSQETKDYPLRKDFSGKELHPKFLTKKENSFVVGIDYPLNTSDVFFHLNLTDDSITECNIDQGYYHIGLEKELESKNYNEVLNKIKYLNYDTGCFWSMTWAMLIEEGNNISIPDKAKGLRMILQELVRIRDHLKTLSQIAYKTQYSSFYNTLIFWYNRCLDQLRSLSNRNSVADMIVIGGMRNDLPAGWMASCTQFLGQLEKKLLEEFKFFYTNSFWNERLVCGVITRKTALESGISGPALRASGVNHDLRKKQPHYFYDEVSFDVPLGIDGKIYDRFLVLVEEIFQSIKIINQVLDNIPAGKIISDDIETFYHLKTKQGIKDNIAYKRIIAHNPEVRFENKFLSMESSNGIIDIWTEFSSHHLTNRVSCSENSSKLVSSFKKEVLGEKLEDLELFWVSLGINMIEVER